jgi:N-acyl-phosphatidylethanolamine-hydrolysing phospholipase D
MINILACDSLQGVLVQLPLLRANTRPITLVIDPMFSPRASPSTYAGPAKYLQDPCSVEDLPPIDFCFISHNQLVVSSFLHP